MIFPAAVKPTTTIRRSVSSTAATVAAVSSGREVGGGGGGGGGEGGAEVGVAVVAVVAERVGRISPLRPRIGLGRALRTRHPWITINRPLVMIARKSRLKLRLDA